MKRPLSAPLLAQLAHHLCAMPAASPSIFDELGPDPVERRNLERWLRQAARSELEAVAIVRELSSPGARRPGRDDIFRAARKIETQFQLSMAEPETRQGRAVCTVCGNSGLVEELRLCWMEWTEQGIRRRARKILNWDEGNAEMANLPIQALAGIYLTSVPCECRKLVESGR
jgi:hypothetical protein